MLDNYSMKVVTSPCALMGHFSCVGAGVLASDGGEAERVHIQGEACRGLCLFKIKTSSTVGFTSSSKVQS